MLKPSTFTLNEEQIRKIRTFYRLLTEGKEFYYTPFPDRLYSDLNYTFTDKHLGMTMLRYLDKRIEEQAIKIMKTRRTKRSKILSIAKLVKGKTLSELFDASEKAVDEINVPEYIVEEIKRLKPTQLTIWSDTPRETVDIYVRKRIDPLYNCMGDISYIVIYATELQHKDGVLTGNVNFIPDEYFRHNIQHIEYLDFLDKHAYLIV